MKLIRFESSAGGPVTMQEDLALRFIRMTGHSMSVPGAILAEDVGEALLKLQQAVDRQMQDTADLERQTAEGRDDDEEPAIALSTRAYPLIKLFEAAARKEKDVLWEHHTGTYV